MPSVSRRSRTVGPTPCTSSSTARSSALNRAGEGAVIAPPSATAPVRDAAWRSIALFWRRLLRAESPAADHLSRPEYDAAATRRVDLRAAPFRGSLGRSGTPPRSEERRVG